MSRSGYADDYVDDDLAVGRYRAQVASAMRGKRGQRFLRDLVEALDDMPVKRLVAHTLQAPDPVCAAATYQAGLEPTMAPCAMGAVGQKRGVDMSWFDPDLADDDPEWSNGRLSIDFDVATQLAAEVQWANDDMCSSKMVKDPTARLGHRWVPITPEERWLSVRTWAAQQIRD